MLYIGIYTGNRGVPFVSDVASQRFWKHLEALTLRGRSIGFTPSNYDAAIGLDRPNCSLVAALRGMRVPRGNGAVKTYSSKVAFASDNWAAFSKIESDRTALDDFTFVYGRFGVRGFAPGITYQQVKNYLSVVEDDLILRHAPRCNIRVTRSRDSHLSVGPGRDAWNVFHTAVADRIAPAVG